MDRIIKKILIINIISLLSITSLFAKGADIEYIDLDAPAVQTVQETTANKQEEKKEVVKEEKNTENKQEIKKNEPKLEKDVDDKLKAYDKEGNLIKSQWFAYNKKTYYIDSNGEPLKKGFNRINGEYYYMNDDCSIHYGWLQLDDKIFYMNPNNKGSLQLTPLELNGELYTFNNDGAFLNKTPIQTQTNNGATTQQINNNPLDKIVKWCKNDVKRSEEYPVDPLLKSEAYAIINKFPTQIVQLLYDKQYQIFMCMEQEESGKDYLTKQSYRDSETKETSDELLPYRVSEVAMFIDCSHNNLNYLYYGMATFAVENINYQGKKPYAYSTWETIQKNKNEELNDLMGLDKEDWPFYKGNAKTSLASTLVHFINFPVEVNQYSSKAYGYIKSWFK